MPRCRAHAQQMTTIFPNGLGASSTPKPPTSLNVHLFRIKGPPVFGIEVYGSLRSLLGGVSLFSDLTFFYREPPRTAPSPKLPQLCPHTFIVSCFSKVPNLSIRPVFLLSPLGGFFFCPVSPPSILEAEAGLFFFTPCRVGSSFFSGSSALFWSLTPLVLCKVCDRAPVDCWSTLTNTPLSVSLLRFFGCWPGTGCFDFLL